MPRKRRRVESQGESRTAAVGRKGGASSRPDYDSQDLPRKRHRSNRVRNKQQKPTVGQENLRDFIPFSSLQDSNFAEDQAMSEPDYGNNRLKSGFRRRAGGDSATYLRAPDDSEEDGEVLSDSTSHPVVYEIDSTDEEGGITLNVQEKGHEPIVISDDEAATGSKQETVQQGSSFVAVNSTTAEASHRANGEDDGQVTPSVGFMIDTSPTTQQLRLKDLSPDQLEEQLKYVFWHLGRDQIDLNRLARCLHCQEEGHINDQCPEKTCKHCGQTGEHNSVFCPEVQKCSTCRQIGHSHCNGMKNNTVPCDFCSRSGHSEQECDMRHSTPFKNRTGNFELWISCCYCASKSHLIGDCQTARVSSSSTPRWTLKNLDPEQITNLSIQKGVDKLERDAQNRGMRPEGMKIRGRAARHNADAGRRDSEDSDDAAAFLGRPRARKFDHRQAPANSASSYRPNNAYDRNNPDSYRPPRNAFYATDSFGRARSRSPPRQAGGRWQSPSTDGSSYRPLDSWPPSRQSSPPRRGNGQDSMQRPGPGISIQLPTRKGSNPNLANNQGAPPHKKRKARHRGGSKWS